MKRYALFAFHEFEACGGWSDLEGIFSKLEHAEIRINDLHVGSEYQIVDLSTGKIIKEGTVSH